MHRGDVDDAPPTTLVHPRQRGLCQQKRRSEHDLDDLPPPGLGELGDRRDMLNARVVHQDVEMALGGERRLNDLAARRCVRQVGAQEPRAWQFGCGGLPCRLVEIGECDVDALTRQVTRNRQANAAGRAGDERDLLRPSGHTEPPAKTGHDSTVMLAE